METKNLYYIEIDEKTNIDNLINYLKQKFLNKKIKIININTKITLSDENRKVIDNSILIPKILDETDQVLEYKRQNKIEENKKTIYNFLNKINIEKNNLNKLLENYEYVIILGKKDEIIKLNKIIIKKESKKLTKEYENYKDKLKQIRENLAIILTNIKNNKEFQKENLSKTNITNKRTTIINCNGICDTIDINLDNENIYEVIEGNGIFIIDDVEYKATKGFKIKVPPKKVCIYEGNMQLKITYNLGKTLSILNNEIITQKKDR